ncbi:MAG: hypothetical protein V1859_02650 [archaeon]
MKVKQAIKKVIALAAGAGIVGATLASAMAADLSTYPQPFVTGGVWSDSVIVIGEKAAPSDVMGAIEIAASLQAAAVTPVNLPGTTIDPTVSTGVKIEKSGNKLNYNDDVQDVDEKLSEDDLDMLAEGTLSDNAGENEGDEDYKQDLTFTTATAQVVYEQDDDTDVTGTYLKFPKGTDVYTYTVDFDNYVEYENGTNTLAKDDFESLTLEMQGNVYTITDAKVNGGELDQLTLLAGDTVKWLQQDQPLTVGDHTVMVVNVNDDSTDRKCGVEVDGVMKWVDVGDTVDFSGLAIGVLDAIAVHSKDYDQDVCQLTVGSQEIVLKSGSEVSVNDVDIDGSDVAFTFKTDRADRLDKIQVTWDPDDDMWLAPGDAMTDPVFGNWKMVFEGMSAVNEEIKFDGGASSGSLTFVNTEGDTVEVPFVYDDATGYEYTHLGEVAMSDFDAIINATTGAQVKLNRTLVMNDNELCQDTSDLSDCEGLLVLAKGAGGEARLLELTSIDVDDDQITFKDVESGAEYTEEYVTTVAKTVDVGFMNLQVTVTEATFKLLFNNVEEVDYMQTEKGARMYLSTTLANPDTAVQVWENEASEGTDGAGAINWTVDHSAGDDDDAVGFSGLVPTGSECTDGSDDYCKATTWGTTFTYDQENDDDITLAYPEGQAYANVFVTPLNAVISAGGSTGASGAEKVNSIPVGMSVLDKDAEALTKNMIVVGGPCVNTVAAELAGNPVDCAEGYEMGKAKVKLYTRKGKTALLVAGYSAQDSLGAAYVLADYKDYATKLKGNEVEVVVASLTDIDVTTPTKV